jgi:hypothetical protein
MIIIVCSNKNMLPPSSMEAALLNEMQWFAMVPPSCDEPSLNDHTQISE